MSETGSTAVRRHVGCRTDDRSLRRPTPPGGGTRRGAGARAAVCGSGFFERQSDEPLLPSGVHEEEDGLAFLVARVFDALDDLGGTVHGTLLHRYDHVSGRYGGVGHRAVGADGCDDDALNALLDAVALPGPVVELREHEAGGRLEHGGAPGGT